MSKPYQLFVGIDWATEKHAVCVVDAQGKHVKEMEPEHSGAGLEKLVEALGQLSGGQPQQVAVSIEVPRGAVVETLLERGFHVHAINPKQLDRFRDRHRLSGAKSDRLDAYVLADALRTDLHLFRPLKMDDPVCIELRELSRTAGDLQDDAARLCGQLRDLLLRSFPALLAYSSGADDAWLWGLLEIAPTPAQAAGLTLPRLTKLLRKHRIRRFTPDELMASLKAKPVFVAPGVAEAVSARLTLLLPRLQLVSEQQRQVERSLKATLDALTQAPHGEDASGQKREHRDAEILLSLPGVGNLVAATMLAEAATAIADRDYPTLRAIAGQAPVARQTGKQGKRGRPVPVTQRRACNARLREAMFHWSRVASIKDPDAKEHCNRLLAQGHSYGRALRGVGDRLLRIFVGMLKSGTIYDPAREHKAPLAKAG